MKPHPYLLILFGLVLGIALTSHRCEREPIQPSKDMINLRTKLDSMNKKLIDLRAKYAAKISQSDSLAAAYNLAVQKFGKSKKVYFENPTETNCKNALTQADSSIKAASIAIASKDSALAACDSALIACEGVVEIRERIDTIQMQVMRVDSAALVRVTTQRDRARRWAVAGWVAALLMGVVR